MPTDQVRDQRRLTASRVAVVVLFVLGGAVAGAWAARIPTVKAQAGLSDAEWGIAILAQPIGNLLALTLVTRVITRSGSRVLAVLGAVGLLVIAPVTAAQHRPALLVVCLLIQGAVTGLLLSPMNALAVDVEHRYRRSILSSFHGWYSIGQLSGALAGALAASAGLSPWRQLALTNALLAVLTAATARGLPDDRHAPVAPVAGLADAPGECECGCEAGRPAAARRRRVPSQLWLLTGIVLLSGLCEGGAVQWGAQFSVSLGATAALGALTLTSYSVSIAVVRMVGDALVNRLGPSSFIRASALISAAGVAVAVGVGTTTAALVGFSVLGVGCACVVPTTFGLAGRIPGIPPSRSVAVVNMGQWPAFFFGPPLIGLLAGRFTLRWAMGVLAVAALGMAVLAGRVRPGAAALIDEGEPAAPNAPNAP